MHGVQVAVLAKAPIAGLAKTRLIPALGAQGAARLQRQLTRGAVHCALDARIGPVTLWCAPHAQHRFFRALHADDGRDTAWCSPAATSATGCTPRSACHCAQGPLLLIGTDCPVLRPSQLRRAARALVDGDDAVFYPAEDGGYVLVGLRRPQPALFDAMTWSTAEVMSRHPCAGAVAGLRVREFETLWDVDLPRPRTTRRPGQRGRREAAWPPMSGASSASERRCRACCTRTLFPPATWPPTTRHDRNPASMPSGPGSSWPDFLIRRSPAAVAIGSFLHALSTTMSPPDRLRSQFNPEPRT